MLILSSSGCSKSVDINQSQLERYPIASDVFTTLQKTVVPDSIPPGSETVLPYEISTFKQNGYGSWSYGPGIDSAKRLDIMPANYSGPSVTNSTRLLNFFAMTDIHITDKETPAQVIYLGYKGGISSGYSPVMLYTTQVLDAAVQTINAIHKENQFDFGISLGDSINSAQYNELRWFIDVLDGKNITPDSGVKDDPISGPYNDYQDEYQAAGLNKTIKWYQTLGNHDHFWMCSFPVNDSHRQSYISDTILKFIDPLADPPSEREYYMGVIDGSTPYGDIVGAGPVGDFLNPPKVVADLDRYSLLRTEWISEFFNTSSEPFGHGFNLVDLNQENGFACYSFVPKSTIPIKVIVLDDTQREDDGSPDIHGHGFLDLARWDWLKKELAAGDAAGQLMVIAAHVPIKVELPDNETAWWVNPDEDAVIQNAVDLSGLIAELQSHPNLLMWLSGHRHLSTVKAFISPDPVNHPEYGFWQVETPSLRDFPQQFRTFEIYLNSDDTISILATNVDPAVKEGTPAATSRKYAIAATQIVETWGLTTKWNPTNDSTIKPMPTGSYNAELVKQLSPAMKAKMKGLGTFN